MSLINLILNHVYDILSRLCAVTKKVWENSALGLALWNRQDVYETGKKRESFSSGPNTNFRLGKGGGGGGGRGFF